MHIWRFCNLYRWVSLQNLATVNFARVENISEFEESLKSGDLSQIYERDSKSCILEVDLDYPVVEGRTCRFTRNQKFKKKLS